MQSSWSLHSFFIIISLKCSLFSFQISVYLKLTFLTSALSTCLTGLFVSLSHGSVLSSLYSACPSSITFSALLGQRTSPSDSNAHQCLTSSHSDDLSFSGPNHLFVDSVNTVIKGTLSLLINECCCFFPFSPSLHTYLGKCGLTYSWVGQLCSSLLTNGAALFSPCVFVFLHT